MDGLFIMENPIKIDDLRVPLFSEIAFDVYSAKRFGKLVVLGLKKTLFWDFESNQTRK